MTNALPDLEAIPDDPREYYYVKQCFRALQARLAVLEQAQAQPKTDAELKEAVAALEARVGVLERVEPAAAEVVEDEELDKCHVSHNVNQSIADSTLAALAFNTEEYDVGGMHDVAVNNSRVTFKKTKKYHITANVIFATNATGIRQIRLRVNGGAYIVMHNFDALASNETSLVASEDYSATAGDYVEVYVYQDSGGPLNVSFIDTRSPRFAVHELA